MSWHAETALLEAYVESTLERASAFSIEAHLIGCASCREQIAVIADRERLARVWSDVQERVDSPSRGFVEATLTYLGAPDHVARLLAATPSLTLSWLGGVAVSLAFAVAAAHAGGDGLVLFLALAPLLPLAGVAVAFGPGVDPTYEIGLASSMRSFELLLIRATAVLLSTTAVSALAATALPHLGWRTAAWLVPALGLTLISLAFATYVPPLRAFGAVALCWTAAVLLLAAAADDGFAAFRVPAQVGFVLGAVVGAFVVARRREMFETGRGA